MIFMKEEENNNNYKQALRWLGKKGAAKRWQNKPPNPSCPDCHSNDVHKYSKYTNKHGVVRQNYRCKNKDCPRISFAETL
jgi:transposase-like protein